MIKWNKKNEKKYIGGDHYYTFARNGLCIRIVPTKKATELDNHNEWEVEFSCFTGGREMQISTQRMKIRQHPDEKKYESNLKSRAGKIAHKLVGQYANRVTKFDSTLAV